MPYELIETVTVSGSSTQIIEFSAIPQDGTDLVCYISARTTVNEFNGRLSIFVNNGAGQEDGEMVYRFSTSLFSGITSTSTWQADVNGSSSTANVFGNIQMYIQNYADSTKPKQSLIQWASENMASANTIGFSIQENEATTPITIFRIEPQSGASFFVSGSTASLYKITAA